MFKKIVMITAFSLVVSACGDGGGGSSAPPERPDGSVSGVAFDNILIDSDIKIFSLDGELLGQSKTDSQGVYTVELKAVPSQVVKIEASNGRYVEEYTNKIIELKTADKLYGYVQYSQGGSISTSVTLYTSIAAGYADYLMRLGVSAEKAVQDANTAMSKMIGVDIVKTTPVDITDNINIKSSLDSSLRYSFFTAAVSPLTAWISRQNNSEEHEFYNSIHFARLAYEDIKHDGLLDGLSAKGNVSMGTVALNQDMYRNRLALNMLVIANHENNKTTITPADLIGAASSLNESNHPAFGTALPIPLDSEKPVVTNPSWFDGETVSGTIALTMEVSDIVGIAAARLLIDGKSFDAADPNKPSFTIDTQTIEDNTYSAVVTFTNHAGAESVFIQGLVIANAGITISNVKPTDGEHIKGTYDFSATVTDPIAVQLVRFSINENIQYLPSNLSNPLESIDTTQTIILEGEHSFRVEATNQGSHSASVTNTFYIDNTFPVVSWGLADGTYLTGDYTFDAAITDNMALKSAKLFWDGGELTDFITADNQTSLNANHVISTLQDFEGEHAISIQVADKAGNQNILTKKVFVDHQPPTVLLTTPSGQVATGQFTINWESNDTNGLKEHIVKINGSTVATLGPDARSFEIAPSGGEGSRTISVTAVDSANKMATSSILKNYKHIPPSFGAVSYSTACTSGCDGGGGIEEQTSVATVAVLNTSGGELSSVTAVNAGSYPIVFHTSGANIVSTPWITGYRREGWRHVVKMTVTVHDIYGLSRTQTIQFLDKVDKDDD